MDYEVNGCPSGSDSDLLGGRSLGDSPSTGSFSWLLGGQEEDDSLMRKSLENFRGRPSCSKLAAGMPVVGVLGTPSRRGPGDS